jgi:hypothetical protein
MRAEFGLPAPTGPSPNAAIDLKELSPEEIQLAVNLYSMVNEKEKKKLATRTDLNPA